MDLKLFQIHIKDLSMPLPCIIYSATAYNKSSSLSDWLAVSKHGYCFHWKDVRSSYLVLCLLLPLSVLPSSLRSPTKWQGAGSAPTTVLILKSLYRWFRKHNRLLFHVERIFSSPLSCFLFSQTDTAQVLIAFPKDRLGKVDYIGGTVWAEHRRALWHLEERNQRGQCERLSKMAAPDLRMAPSPHWLPMLGGSISSGGLGEKLPSPGILMQNRMEQAFWCSLVNGAGCVVWVIKQEGRYF